MRRVFLLTVLISILIIGVTVSTEVAKLGAGENTLQSIYKEDRAVLFFLDPDSSFYTPYYLNGASPEFIIRKFGHFLTYGLLAGIIFVLLPTKNLLLKGLLSFTSASFIGLLDEIHQHFLLNRSGRILDVYINMAGSIMSVLLLVSLNILFRWVKGAKIVNNFRRL